MNREIKFRAWDDINKKWLLGYDKPNLGGFSMLGEVMAFGEYNKMLSSFNLEDWDKIILMQFTGLKDRNGKEIYEGDVIRCTDDADEISELNSDTGYGNVEWLNESGMWYVYEINNGIDILMQEGYIEVIGNIYENPELLKQQS